MKKEDYLDILKQNVALSVEKLEFSQNWMLQQDNGPKHTSKIVKEWLFHYCPKSLCHPLQSRDLNPIQHLWEYPAKKLEIEIFLSIYLSFSTSC